MYKLIFLLSVTLTSFKALSQVELISQSITEFASAADASDVNRLENITNADYRIVMNQLFGSTEIAVMNRSTYLKMIADGKFGGDQREVTIHNVIINGNNALADVTFQGEELTIRSFLNLGKTAQGKWLIISDTPQVQ